MAGDSGLDELASELDAIAERLSDAAMDVLREALADPSPEGVESAKKSERRINRARAAVEKASHLLRS